jgi:hypothetical protein
VDQPTSLSSPLVRRSPTLPAPYPLAYISDTTSTSLLDEFLIEVRAIRKDHVSKGVFVLVAAVGLERDFLSIN